MSKYLITGVLGFIGSYLAKHILRNDYDSTVVGIARNSTQQHLKRLEGQQLHPSFKLIYKDFAKDDISEIFNDVDFCIHAGGKTAVNHSVIDPQPFIESNIIGTYKMLEATRKAKSLKRYIQVGTDEEYGPIASGSWKEDSPINPTNPYSYTKMCSSLMALTYHKTYGLPIIVTRTENVYGPYQEPIKVIPAWTKRALNGDPLLIYGDGKHRRQWIHVSDNCDAFLFLLEHGKIGEIYNIAGEEELENIELAKRVLQILGKEYSEKTIQFIPDKDIRPFHDRRYSIDVSKLKALGWQRKYSLEQGLRETVNWYKKNSEWLL